MADEVKAGDIVQTPFGDLEVISVYPESDAIADGFLVNLEVYSLSLPGRPWTTVNIATTALFHAIQADAESEVDDSEATDEERDKHIVLAIYRRLKAIVVGVKDLAEEDEPKDWHFGSQFLDRKVWIMGNGTPYRYTMMYPEDY